MVTAVAFRYSHTIGRYALGGPGYINPVDVAIGPDGNLYVLSRGHHELSDGLETKRVTVCSPDGDYLREFLKGGTEDGDLLWPSAIALDGDGNIYISDEALQRISVYDNAGQFMAKWGVKGAGDGQFDRPAGMVFDGDGNLLVTDGLNNRVQRYTKEGKFLGGWGKGGRGNGELNIPWGIDVDKDGNVYVADWRNDRIQKFTANGGHLASYGSSGQGDGQFNRPSSVAVDGEGLVYIADRGNERVQVLGPDGSFIGKLRGEGGWSKLAMEWFNSSNLDLRAEWENANLEPELDSAPTDFPRYESASVIKYFWGPTSVKVDDQGRFYVVESCRHRIQAYQKGST